MTASGSPPTGLAAQSSVPVLQGRSTRLAPGWLIVVAGVALFIVSALAYHFESQLSAALPGLVTILLPVWGLIMVVLWILIVIFHGPPDHLKANRVIGLPFAVAVFAIEWIGLWLIAWAGAIEAESLQRGGLQYVPAPESWAIPFASGVVWAVVSIVYVVLSVKMYLYDPRKEVRRPGT